MSNPAAAIRKWGVAPAKQGSHPGLVVLFGLAAVLAGLMATTASLLLVGLIAGLIGGGFLLARPRAAITLIIAAGLTMGALLSLAGPSFERLSWVVSLLGFFLLIPAILHANNLRYAPAFVHVVLAFSLLALGTTLMQWYSSAEVLSGVKHTFQAIGMFFALALLPLSEKNFTHWRRLLIFISVLQVPFALYEFFVLVPKRGGLEAGAAVTDVVAGTFGAALSGGSNNSGMALLLLIVLAFVFSHWKEKLLKTRYVVVGLPLLMIPIALGEVKVAFVLLPLMLIVLFKQEIYKRPGVFFGIAIAGVVVMFVLGLIYVDFIIKKPLSRIISETIDYNIGNRGYGHYVLNRTSVYSFWWQQQGLHDPVGFMLGHGLGSSFAAPKSISFGHLAGNWPYHGINLTAASSLLWDTGIIGLMLFIAIFPASWYACNRLLRDSRSAHLTAEVAAIRSVLPLFAVFVIYNNSLVTSPTMEILFSLLFGYLAFLYRNHCKSSAG
jgi:hypothetical protein